MRTRLPDDLRTTALGQEADRILRSCVHCGFCTATCPTYQLLGDELDGPRGRIYQIKQMLEGEAPTRVTQRHLDRCLTCLNCMTTCPSGVAYDRLIDLGRERVEALVKRPPGERLLRWSLRHTLPYPRRFGPLLRLAQTLRPLLPARLRVKLPARAPRAAAAAPGQRHARRVIVLDHCGESCLTPATAAALPRVLDRLGIQALRGGGGCCGALSQHLSAPRQARTLMRRNIDAWWPHLEAGAEAIVVAASGCGALVKHYGEYLRDDPAYAARAARVAALARDPCELIDTATAAGWGSRAPKRIAFHPPCTLQHGQRLAGRVEALLDAAGFARLPVRDSHSCCGAAGTYSLLQAELSTRLRDARLTALEDDRPALIATANVGCQTHLQGAARVPVVHWLELFDPDRDWP